MSDQPTLIKRGKEARQAILNAVNEIANTVKITLGPGGKNVLLQQDWRGQRITNDGTTIAESISLADPFEKVVGRSFVETSKNTASEAGDGTTTSIVLAQAIINKAFSKLDDRSLVADDSNVMNLKRDIDKAKDKVIEELKKMSKPVKSQEELEKICIVSMEDEKLGKMIAKIVWKVGADGYIAQEENFKNEITTDTIEGMKFNGKYIDERLATNRQKQAEYKNCPIIVTNHEIGKGDIEKMTQIIGEVANRKGKTNLVIFAQKFTREMQNVILRTTFGGKFAVLAVKSPSLTSGDFQDLAVYTGAKFIDKNQDMAFKDLTLDDIGEAKKVAVDDDQSIVIGGKGTKEEVDKRIQELKDELEVEKVDSFQRLLKKRIANMASGVGVVNIGAKTEMERRYLKLKIEDAIFAGQSALKEGYVKGGGQALKEIADKNPDLVIADALRQPYEILQKNAGGELKIDDNIIDPTKVERAALENSCSIASMLLTTEAIVVERSESRMADSIEQAVDLLTEGIKIKK